MAAVADLCLLVRPGGKLVVAVPTRDGRMFRLALWMEKLFGSQRGLKPGVLAGLNVRQAQRLGMMFHFETGPRIVIGGPPGIIFLDFFGSGERGFNYCLFHDISPFDYLCKYVCTYLLNKVKK